MVVVVVVAREHCSLSIVDVDCVRVFYDKWYSSINDIFCYMIIIVVCIVMI